MGAASRAAVVFMIADLAMERPLRRRRWFQQCDIEFFPAKPVNRWRIAG